MYRHRPDPLSLVFGLLFVTIGAGILLVDPRPDLADLYAVGVAIALASGVAIIASLLVGDVHAQAAERLAAARQPTPTQIGDLPLSPILDDPLFDPPIDPEALDRAYRETFGDDDRDQAPTPPEPG